MVEIKSALGKKKKKSVLITVGVALIYLAVLGAGSFLVFSKVRETVAASDMLPNFTLNTETKQNIAEDEEKHSDAVMWAEWTDTERVTVLLLGIDERQHEEGPWRTDTMIVLTLDPVTMQAGVLSIPRDLWVHIPGYGENRINTAHFLGDAFDHPGGGPALAEETVAYNLGIAIDYYVRLNFKGFVRLVNEIGGIDVDVPQTIDDPYYPDEGVGYDPLYIEAGAQHFDGEMALKYARTRHTEHGDFDRARRQQDVMLAIMEKVTRPDNLPHLVSRAPEIYQAVDASIQTDLKLDEIMALGMLASKVDRDDIRFGVVDEQTTMAMTTPDEQQILLPLRDEMRRVRDYVFGIERPSGETVGEESATISVLNGTETPGLAGATSEYLTSQGFLVSHYDNADRPDYEDSLIILNRDKPLTALKLLELLNLPQSAVVKGSNPTASYDVIIILGEDYAAKQSASR